MNIGTWEKLSERLRSKHVRGVRTFLSKKWLRYLDISIHAEHVPQSVSTIGFSEGFCMLPKAVRPLGELSLRVR